MFRSVKASIFQNSDFENNESTFPNLSDEDRAKLLSSVKTEINLSSFTFDNIETYVTSKNLCSSSSEDDNYSPTMTDQGFTGESCLLQTFFGHRNHSMGQFNFDPFQNDPAKSKKCFFELVNKTDKVESILK